MKTTFKNIVEDKQGNLAIISAVSLMVLLLGGGISLDLTQTHSAKKAMQNSLDAAVLAAATTDQSDLRETVARAYHTGNDDKGTIVQLEITQTDQYRDVTAYASFDRPLNFAKILGKNTAKIGVRSVARASLAPSCVKIRPAYQEASWAQHLTISGIPKNGPRPTEAGNNGDETNSSGFGGFLGTTSNTSFYDKHQSYTMAPNERILLDRQPKRITSSRGESFIKEIAFEAPTRAVLANVYYQEGQPTHGGLPRGWNDCIDVKSYEKLFLNVKMETSEAKVIRRKLAVDAIEAIQNSSQKEYLLSKFEIKQLKYDPSTSGDSSDTGKYAYKIYDAQQNKLRDLIDQETHLIKDAVSQEKVPLAIVTRALIEEENHIRNLPSGGRGTVHEAYGYEGEKAIVVDKEIVDSGQFRHSGYELAVETEATQFLSDIALPIPDPIVAAIKRNTRTKDAIDYKAFEYERSVDLIDSDIELVSVVPQRHLIEFAASDMKSKKVISETQLQMATEPFDSLKYMVKAYPGKLRSDDPISPMIRTEIKYELSQLLQCSNSDPNQPRSMMNSTNPNTLIFDFDQFDDGDGRDNTGGRPGSDSDASDENPSPSGDSGSSSSSGGSSTPTTAIHKVAVSQKYLPPFKWEIEVECNSAEYVYLLE